MSVKFTHTSNKENKKQLTTQQLKQQWDAKLDDPEFDMSFFEFRRQRLAELHQEPENKANWKNRKGWEKSSIGSNAKTSLYVMWGFCIVFYLILSPLIFNFQDELNKGNSEIWFALILPVGGLFLIYKTIMLTLEYRRFGNVYYEMDPYPGAIGGQLGGRVVVTQLSYQQLEKQDAKKVEVKLECVYSYSSGNGEDRTLHEDIQWSQTGTPKFEQHGKGVDFSFYYDIPAHLAESSLDEKGAYYFWRLTLKAELEGVDLNRTFIVPVLKGEKKSRYVSHSISEQVAEKKQLKSEQTQEKISSGDFNVDGLSKSMLVDDTGHSMLLRFPMFRSRYLTSFCMLFAAGFGFASYNIIGLAFGAGYFGILLGVFSIPFVLVALFSGIAAIYLPLANLKVTLNLEKIDVLKRWAFIPIYTGSMKVSNIQSINIIRTGSTGSGENKVEDFKLQITNDIEQTMTIAEDIKGKEIALQFAEYLCKKFDIAAEPAYVKKRRMLKRHK